MEHFTHHDTVVKDVEDIAIKPCHICCPREQELYHCPFCVTSTYKPTYRSRLVSHLKLHIGRGLKYKDLKIIHCDCPLQDASSSTSQSHFHCPYCPDVGVSHTWGRDHIAKCEKRHCSSSKKEKQHCVGKASDKLDKVLAQKKARRPRECVRTATASSVDGTVTVKQEPLDKFTVASPTPKTGKRRGRPTKTPKTEISKGDSAAVLSTVDTPKKRGRPPKTSPIVPIKIEPDEQTPVSQVSCKTKKSHGAVATEIFTKKVARKTKATVDSSITSTSQNQEADTREKGDTERDKEYGNDLAEKEEAITAASQAVIEMPESVTLAADDRENREKTHRKSKFTLTTSVFIGRDIFPVEVTNPEEIARSACEGLNVTCVETNDGFALSGAWEEVLQAKEMLEVLLEAAEVTVAEAATDSHNKLMSDTSEEREEEICQGNSDEAEVKKCAYSIDAEEFIMNILNIKDEEQDDELDETDPLSQRQGKVDSNQVKVYRNRMLYRAPDRATKKCDQCGYRSTLEGVRKHKIRKHSGKEVNCDVCGKIYCLRYEMRRHRMGHFELDGSQTTETSMWITQNKPELKELTLQDLEKKYPKTIGFRIVSRSKTGKAKYVPKKPFVQWQCLCTYCKCTLDVEQLLDHWKGKHYSPMYNCSLCEEVLGGEETHQCPKSSKDEVALPIPFCSVCGHVAQTKDEVEVHAESSHKPVFKCIMCEEEKDTCNSFLIHCKKVHLQQLRQLPREDTLHECSTCQRVFKKEAQLTLHMRVHMKHELLKCETCNFTTSLPGLMKAHVKRQHNTMQYICELCGKSFGSTAAANFHKASVHNEGNFSECTVCGKKFTTNRFLKVHMKRVHQKEKKHLCSVCNKGFFELFRKNEHEKLAHMPDHLKEEHKKFECTYCGKRFLKKVAMAQHENTHTGAKPYKCRICNKGFSYCSEVRKHEISHSNERPYRCCHCGKGFKFPFKLRAHMIIHTKIGPHACDKCGKVFTALATLRKHACKANRNKEKELAIAMLDEATEKGVTYCVACGTVCDPRLQNQACCPHAQLVQAVVMDMNETETSEGTIQLKMEESEGNKHAETSLTERVDFPKTSIFKNKESDENSMQDGQSIERVAVAASTTYMCGVCNSMFHTMELVNEHMTEHMPTGKTIGCVVEESGHELMMAQELLTSVVADEGEEGEMLVMEDGKLLRIVHDNKEHIEEHLVMKKEENYDINLVHDGRNTLRSINNGEEAESDEVQNNTIPMQVDEGIETCLVVDEGHESHPLQVIHDGDGLNLHNVHDDGQSHLQIVEDDTRHYRVVHTEGPQDLGDSEMEVHVVEDMNHITE